MGSLRQTPLAADAPLTRRKKSFTIAIVGGGLSGLILATGLSRRGINVRVYEAKASFTEISAGISISPNAYRAMKRVDPRIVDIYEKARTLNASKEEQGVWFHFRLGQQEGLDLVWPVAIDAEENGNLHRGRFLAELVGLLPDKCARLGKSLVAIDQGREGVRMHFSDGSEDVADAVVGCDGIHSAVRKLMLGDAPESRPSFTGAYAYRGLVRMEDAIAAVGEQLACNSQVYMGEGGNVVTYPIDDGQMLNVVAFRKHREDEWKSDNWLVEASPEQLMADFEGWSKPVLELLKFVNPTTIWGIHDHLPCDSYAFGCVILLGDAAHASTAHAGAGAGVGIEDAFILCELLSDPSVKSPVNLPAVFRTYDKMRRPRTQNLVAHSRKLGEMFQMRAEGVGSDVSVLRQRLNGVNDWLWNFELDTHLEEGKRELSRNLGEWSFLLLVRRYMQKLSAWVKL